MDPSSMQLPLDIAHELPSSISQYDEQFVSHVPDVVFPAPVPHHWAMFFTDRNGTTREVSNLLSQSAVFTCRLREDFIAVKEVAAHRGQHTSLIPATTAYSFTREEPGHSQHARRGTVHKELPAGECMKYMKDKAELVALEIGDTKRVTAYYDSAFKRLQQANCSTLAKCFIKLIEPHKKATNPYNGGQPPAGAQPGEKGDPEKTKPDWWPRGVIHREPDHLKKDSRLKLLVHIVQNLSPMGITAEKLQEVANDNRRYIKPQEKISILDILLRVRRLEERYELNEIDANTIIYVMDHEEAKKGEQEPDNEMRIAGVSTPPDSLDGRLFENSRSIDLAGLSQDVFPTNSNPTLQVPAGVNLGSQDRPMHQFQVSKADISHQTLVNTPIAAAVPPPENYQYVNDLPFASPTSHEQLQAASHQANHSVAFTGWSPALQQNVFAPTDYSRASRHVPPQVVYPTYSVYPVPSSHAV